MKDKEKILISIIIMILGAVLSYRITYIDSELKTMDSRIDKIIEAK